ncbi:MAG TPA: phage tail protein [Candidatus Sulfotelmatobacter sp.]|jgi:phage tail-like protein|nr:phage tail protein [Candidatus Sulfotelmatobacter sp.]
MSTTYYPPVCFYFEVKFVGINTSGDSSFAEADGLESELGVMEIKEGGENRFTHRLPDRATHRNLTLKRGVMTAASDLVKWCKSTLESDMNLRVKTRNINVTLLDENAKPLLVWTFYNAWPVKWNMAGLDAKKNEIALETLEFSYSYCSRDK